MKSYKDINQLLRNKQNEREEQIKNLEESVAFLSDKINAFLASQPHNRIVHENGQIKGIELEPEINSAIAMTAEVIPSSSSSSLSIKNQKTH